ncbi:uncharacterized protein FA14DRAFT_159495 [Meira miltonrushii]|uniref:20S-pre-rRNA D-site endonuclease NOB1 n=1 Tax=Meira miltonrushii TaxID=1280837 RepID=A0A316VMW3_9BASI|nr:uncharacterized protein FA14DRAFT_159495 [Meira miltonrushii]PWN37441.1 hypothetical protein FA14DRAFT_159495 [Meira miltonrushii]
MTDIAEGSTSVVPQIDELILDAGPLVTQQRLVGLAKKFYVPSAVVAELRDKQARDHFQRLQDQSNAGQGGFTVEIREPSAEAKMAVMGFAKQTGDYAVLSQPDLSVLALTYALEVQKHGQWRIRDTLGGLTGQQKQTQQQKEQNAGSKGKNEGNQKQKMEQKMEKRIVDPPEEKHSESIAKRLEEEGGNRENTASKPLGASTDAEIQAMESTLASTSIADEAHSSALEEAAEPHNSEEEALNDDEDDEETGGEWITPDNIDKHKSRALGLVSDSDLSLLQGANKTRSNGRMRTTVTEADDGWSTVTSKNTVQKPAHASAKVAGGKKSANKPPARMTVACMTGDYAVQNVLLQMGLSLVGLEGTRIRQVKSWVLRCHACFKICKDSERKFCPQCGNPTLLRTSVTSTDPQLGKEAGMQIHLKKNFQYKNRGTKFSLPLPKPGKAGGVQASVPILREDQAEWQKALQREKVQKNKEERALQKALERGSDSLSARYEDADTLSILLAGKTSGQGYQGLPQIGVGRRNPNEKHRRKV